MTMKLLVSDDHVNPNTYSVEVPNIISVNDKSLLAEFKQLIGSAYLPFMHVQKIGYDFELDQKLPKLAANVQAVPGYTGPPFFMQDVPEYDLHKTYKVGALVKHEGKIYGFNPELCAVELGYDQGHPLYSAKSSTLSELTLASGWKEFSFEQRSFISKTPIFDSNKQPEQSWCSDHCLVDKSGNQVLRINVVEEGQERTERIFLKGVEVDQEWFLKELKVMKLPNRFKRGDIVRYKGETTGSINHGALKEIVNPALDLERCYGVHSNTGGLIILGEDDLEEVVL